MSQLVPLVLLSHAHWSMLISSSLRVYIASYLPTIIYYVKIKYYNIIIYTLYNYSIIY